MRSSRGGSGRFFERGESRKSGAGKKRQTSSRFRPARSDDGGARKPLDRAGKPFRREEKRSGRAGKPLGGAGKPFGRARSTPNPATIERLIQGQAWDDLVPHVVSAGADPAIVIPKLRRFAYLVIEWNRKVSNLISRNDEPRIVVRHFRESIEPAHRLRSFVAGEWLDFGSGAGFPAIPLALLGIGEHWTLVESRRPKTLFLRKALEELGLKHVDVFHGRLESWISEGARGGSIDAMCSRATLALEPTLELAKPIVRLGGHAFLWKGSRRSEELANRATWSASWDLLETLDLADGPGAVAILSRRS